MNNTQVPFLDLIAPHVELEDELVESFRTALRCAQFIGGSALGNFEKNFAAYHDVAECVGAASGTDALLLALLAGGVKPGETVLTTSNTFIATAEAISQAGAMPEFIDIDEETCNLSPAKLRTYLESCSRDASGRSVSCRTGSPITAVLPVHLYGQMADMDAIEEIAAEFGLQVYEDACQAHGAEYFSRRLNRWRKAGSVGRAAAFSFYPGKNLGACGEGGAVTTQDAELAVRARMLRDHGQSRKYYHELVGFNGRLDAIQAGILDIKLKHLPEWTRLRCEAAARYDANFKNSPQVVTPVVPAWAKPVYHLYVVRVQERDEVQAKLGAAGIGTGIHYPVPIHLQNAYSSLGYCAGDLPVTERCVPELLSLPMFPQITEEQQNKVVEATVQATDAVLSRP
ncbi:MAG: DegT/DnrJ/EryC1/StrS family aminotransferase [Acidobacteriota bacterium]|nr:DegT/DnrJ/EryC1/StrS family aminotransferase [Acidobacteriota bacterium]